MSDERNGTIYIYSEEKMPLFLEPLLQDFGLIKDGSVTGCLRYFQERDSRVSDLGLPLTETS